MQAELRQQQSHQSDLDAVDRQRRAGRFRGSVNRAVGTGAYGKTGARERRRDNSVTLVLTRYTGAHQSGCPQSSRRGWRQYLRTRTCRAWRARRRSIRRSAPSVPPACKNAQRLRGAPGNVRLLQWFVARTARKQTGKGRQSLRTLKFGRVGPGLSTPSIGVSLRR